MNRRLLLPVIVVAVLGLIGAIRIGMYLTSHEYRSPARSEIVETTPRTQALIDEAAAQELADAEKPYVEEEYRQFPVVGSRVAVWVLAQLHLLFGAFVLAVPIFALIIEFIGYRSGDKRYDRLAYEFTKLLTTSFSLRRRSGHFCCSCW